MKPKNYEICPKCGKKAAIAIRETKTFDEPVRQYRCLNCNHIF